MKILLKNAQTYVGHVFQKKDILISDGKIGRIEECGVLSSEGYDRVIDCEGKKAVPGFIDVHTHGAAGIDVNAATAEGLETIARFFASQGTTSCLVSILTDTPEQTLWCIDEYNKWKTLEHKGAEIIGIHLEGPFLASEYKGAMPEHLLKKAPDLELVKRYQDAASGAVRYMTISPELEGMPEFIRDVSGLGIKVAIGHSGASYERAMEAIQSGAVAGTHVGNAMKLLHQHFPAIFGAVLESDVYCEMICDGLHLHPGTVRILLKAKGLDRAVAITDSIMAAGLPDGEYKLGVNDVVVVDGDAKLKEGGVRAGSTLTLAQAYRNLLKFTGRTEEEILPVLTKNPSEMLGVYNELGSIEEGKAADILIMDADRQICTTIVRGRICEK
ncbi:MAG TPA: N-acetylglucosamine-6-phosphate deacetylase [Candidatus Mediterraneibacter merdavium]|nr:N-acetylglucosamine-6-phosphate deacetylase [Candidatus Mediterraneibacter merdavium]